MTAITDIIGREILDSRGNPTVEVDVILETARAAAPLCPPAPRPARTRRWNCATATRRATVAKACEGGRRGQRRDIRRARRHGRGSAGQDRRDPDRARRHAEQGQARRQRHPRRFAGRRQGRGRANKLPLYRYVGGAAARVLPVPMMNIVNGGVHADNPIDFQEFMIMPVGAPTFAEALRGSAPKFSRRCKGRSRRPGYNTNVGDEGGFAPNLKIGGSRARLSSCRRSRRPATSPARTSMLALDCAATEFFKNGKYRLRRRGQERVDSAKSRRNISPILSRAIRSSRSRMAWPRTTWTAGRRSPTIGDKCQLVGDDLFVTNVTRLSKGIEGGTAIRSCQGQSDRHAHRDARRGRDGAQGRLHRGDVASLRRDRGFDHRRPRRRHQLRADQDRLAARSDRTAKYNQLLRIEEELGAAGALSPAVRRLKA